MAIRDRGQVFKGGRVYTKERGIVTF